MEELMYCRIFKQRLKSTFWLASVAKGTLATLANAPDMRASAHARYLRKRCCMLWLETIRSRRVRHNAIKYFLALKHGGHAYAATVGYKRRK